MIALYLVGRDLFAIHRAPDRDDIAQNYGYQKAYVKQYV